MDRRHHRLCLVAAALSGCGWFLAGADFDIWPFAWVALVPLLWAIDRARSTRRAILYGWITGLVANVGGFYWIAPMLVRFAYLPIVVGVLGLVLLAAYQAVVFALFALAMRELRVRWAARTGAPLAAALLAPLVMVSAEMLVPFIFPWYLAVTAAWLPPVIQIAELTGPLGISALIAAVGGGIYDAIAGRGAGWRRQWAPGGAAVLALAAALVFGFVRLGQIDSRRSRAPQIEVGLVQGNVGFETGGDEEAAGGKLSELHSRSADLERRGADLIVWAETSYPYPLLRERDRDFPPGHTARIRAGFGAPLIFGGITVEPGDDDHDRRAWNSAIMIDRDGRFRGRYDKVYLLVFGEYVPFAGTFPWLQDAIPAAGDFERGDGVTSFPFEHEGARYRLAPLICYEDILPRFTRRVAALHPHLLVNVTNDSWFGDSSEPWQHLALSVFRAVEMRTDMVRAVNSGVSAFIDAGGRVYRRTYVVDPDREARAATGSLATVSLLEGGHTLYARLGDVFGYLCLLALVVIAGTVRFRNY